MKNKRSGFTIIEIVIGTALLSFAITGIVQLIQFQQQTLKVERIDISKNRTLAALFETLRKVAKHHQSNFDGVEISTISEMPSNLASLENLPYVFDTRGGIVKRPEESMSQTGLSGIFWGYQVDQLVQGQGANRKAMGLILVRVRVVELEVGNIKNDKVYYLYVGA